MFEKITALIRATTRPFVTYCLVGTLCVLVVTGHIDTAQFVSLTTMVVGFWFGSRGKDGPSGSN